ncbi:MAG TPA: hypothetical protein VKA34_03180 [Balneolales bacterium]|nr:hypothetical protein [Balneolales bacterium]
MSSLKKHKEKVLIIAGNTVIKKKKCVVDGDRVIIEKPNRGRGNIGWTPSFKSTDFKYKRNIFGILKRHLEIKQDAKKFIPFGAATVDVPTCSRKDIEEYGNAKVISKSGMTQNELQVPIVLYLLIGGVLILQLLSFLMSQGMVVLPQ